MVESHILVSSEALSRADLCFVGGNFSFSPSAPFCKNKILLPYFLFGFFCVAVFKACSKYSFGERIPDDVRIWFPGKAFITVLAQFRERTDGSTAAHISISSRRAHVLRMLTIRCLPAHLIWSFITTAAWLSLYQGRNCEHLANPWIPQTHEMDLSSKVNQVSSELVRTLTKVRLIRERYFE